MSVGSSKLAKATAKDRRQQSSVGNNFRLAPNTVTKILGFSHDFSTAMSSILVLADSRCVLDCC